MRPRPFDLTVLLVAVVMVLAWGLPALGQARVPCAVAPYTVVEGPVPEPYAATYTWPTRVINVLPKYRGDAGVMFHEIGHHFYFECLASEHPYWADKPERFANAWAEYRLGYDVHHYDVPWIDAYWMRLWAEARTFYWEKSRIGS